MPKESQKNIIVSVAPLTRIPLTRNQSFSYISPQALPIGSLLTIPLFFRTVSGVVTSINANADKVLPAHIRLKRIHDVIEESFLTPQQIALAHITASLFLCPLGVVLKHFVPKRVRERKKSDPVPRDARHRLPILTTPQKKTRDAILSKRASFATFLLTGPAASGKTTVIQSAIEKIRTGNRAAQVLILLPEILLTSYSVERYRALFDTKETVVLHSKLSKGAYYAAWRSIKDGSAKIILGTRNAIFAPFQSLSLIACDEAHDISFKQWDMAPRYDARSLAHALGRIWHIPVIFATATPRVEDIHRFSHLTDHQLLSLPSRTHAPRIVVVNLRTERWKKRFGPISPSLTDEMRAALAQKRQVILFVNHQGASGFSFCMRCRAVLRCPQCERALVHNDQNDTYRCLHCTYRSQTFPSCPSCKGITFRDVGIGTQKIEKEVQKIFPHATVRRADAQSTRTRGMMQHIQDDFSHGAIDILIGTQMVTKGWDLKNVACVGMIDADILLRLPEYTAGENAFAHITQLAGRVMHSEHAARNSIVIQTFHPEDPTIAAVVASDFSAIYESELPERRALSLPPFGRIVKIIYQHPRQEVAERMAAKSYRDLTSLCAHDKNIIFSEPHHPLLENIRGRHRRQIIIKIKDTAPDVMPASLRGFLERLDQKWIIDCDPIGLL